VSTLGFTVIAASIALSTGGGIALFEAAQEDLIARYRGRALVKGACGLACYLLALAAIVMLVPA
jgi:hypothetical protein